VDLRVLDEHDQPDSLFPVFKSVPLPAFCAVLERDVFGFPEPGTIVELAFAYGLPNKPSFARFLPRVNAYHHSNPTSCSYNRLPELVSAPIAMATGLAIPIQILSTQHCAID
jgi:hypothetical protein